MAETDLNATVLALAAALAAGLVVGLERGWRKRELPEGGRVAGLRTFALIGLLGGALAMPGLPDSWAGVGLAGVALLFAVSWQASASAAGSLSITTAIAAQATFALRLGGYLLLLGIATLAAAALLWQRRERGGDVTVPAQARLFDLGTAVGFGVALGLIAVLVRAGKQSLGDAGIFAVAFLSGLADVDAIVIATVQMHAQQELGAAATATAILLAALANMVVKGGMAWTIAGRAVGARVAAAFVAVALVGVAAAALASFIGR